MCVSGSPSFSNDYVRDMYHLGRRAETVYTWHEVIDDITVSVMENVSQFWCLR